MCPSSAAQDNPARDVDEIGCRDEITEHKEKLRHRFSRENITRKENTWQNRQEGQLHGLSLRAGFARNQDSQRQRNEQERKRQASKQQYVTMDRNSEHEP